MGDGDEEGPSPMVLLCLVFKASALWADAFYKSKCPYVCLSVCLFVCLFTFEVPFNGLFAPTSRSRMSNIFRDTESFGKSNGKKWSQIWTFLFGSGLKLPRKKKFFFCADFAFVHPSMASVLLSASVERCFVSHMRDFLLGSGLKSSRKKKFIFCGPVSVRRLYNDMRRLYWDMRRLYNDMRRLYWNMRRLYW